MAGFYDQLALDYHRIYPDWDASMARQGQALDAVIHAQLGIDHAAVLDCSCGIGTQAIALSRRGHRVTGTDISPLAGSALALRVDPERPEHFEVSRDSSDTSYDDEPVTTPGVISPISCGRSPNCTAQGHSPMTSSSRPSVVFSAAEPRSGQVGELAQRAGFVRQLLSRDGGP